VAAKRGDHSPIDRFDRADSVAIGRLPHVQHVRIGDDLLDENLLVILLAERAKVVAGRIAVRRFGGFERDDLEGGLGRGARLGGNHAAKTCDPPRSHVIVLIAHGDQKLFRECHLGHGTLVDGECLKELRSVTHGFGMLDDDPDRAGFGAVGDFDPVAADAWGREKEMC
jgi:hypothetical protein